MYAIVNLGTIFAIICIYLLLMFVQSVAYLFSDKFFFAEKVSNKLYNFLYWNGVLRLLMEGYLEILIATMLNCVRNNRVDRSYSIIFSNVFSLLMTGLLIVLPVFILIYYRYRKKDWESEEFQETWGAPLEGLELDPKMPMTEDEIKELSEGERKKLIKEAMK